MLDADRDASWNFQRACDQIREEQGSAKASGFAFDMGRKGFNWTGSQDTLMERVAEMYGYRVDWHGANKEEP